tara:strand:- start:1576 stop:2262 length:687 start_codon:yes stop_codon:yes gene_type:complete
MSKKKKINAITEFALAEFGSAVEMLQAAKLAPDTKMAAGFIDHAVDEYRHANEFRKISSAAAQRENISGLRQLLSRNLVDNRIVDPNGFLFEKFSFDRFCFFVFLNETFAMRHFATTIIKDDLLTPEEKDIVGEIARDEEKHIHHAGKFVSKIQKSDPFKSRRLMLLERAFLFKRNLQSRTTKINQILSTVVLSFSLFIFALFLKTINLRRQFDTTDREVFDNHDNLF